MIAMYISRSKAALAKTVRIILFVIGGFGILLCLLTPGTGILGTTTAGNQNSNSCKKDKDSLHTI